jgi:hypothetical protein
MERNSMLARLTSFAAVFALSSIGALAQSSSDAQHAIAELDKGSKFFEMTQDGRIVHRQSGLICGSEIGDSGRVSLSVIDPETGHDVRCDYFVQGLGKLTVTVTKLPPDLTVNTLMRIVMQSSADSLIDARRVAGPETEVIKNPATGDSFAPLTVTYASNWAGSDYLTKVWLANVNGWAVKAYASYIDKPKSPAEGWGKALWMSAAESVNRGSPRASAE